MTSSAFWSILATTLAGTSTAAVPVPRLFEPAPEHSPAGGHVPDLRHREQPVKRRRLTMTKGFRRRWALLIVLIASASRLALDAVDTRGATPAQSGEASSVVETRRQVIEEGAHGLHVAAREGETASADSE